MTSTDKPSHGETCTYTFAGSTTPTGPRPAGPRSPPASCAHQLWNSGEWTDDDHAALADLGYEGERTALTIPIKKTTDAPLTADQRTVNLLHAAIRAPAERGHALLTTTFQALRRISPCPWRIGAIAAALVLLYHVHGRTT